MATNVRGFLGLTRYIATLLPVLAKYMSMLTLLTTKECDWEFPWTTEHQTAFEHIKDLVLGTDCLTVIIYEEVEFCLIAVYTGFLEVLKNGGTVLFMLLQSL